MLNPFPPDKLAQMRQDFCINPENLSRSQDLLSCSLSAKQCGSYISAINDPLVANSAIEPLSRTMEGLSITGWLGNDVHQVLDGVGACSTLAVNDKYRSGLWNDMGYSSVKNAYIGVQNSLNKQPANMEVGNQQYVLTDPMFGSSKFFLARYLHETQTPKSLR